MAGLWERVKSSGTERVNVHLVIAGIKGYSAGVFTAQQVTDALNRNLTLQSYATLTAVEIADLSAIATQITAAGSVTNKLVYVVGKLEPVMMAAETGDCSEAFWRTALGIS